MTMSNLTARLQGWQLQSLKNEIKEYMGHGNTVTSTVLCAMAFGISILLTGSRSDIFHSCILPRSRR